MRGKNKKSTTRVGEWPDETGVPGAQQPAVDAAEAGATGVSEEAVPAAAKADGGVGEESAERTRERLLRLQADFDNFRKRTIRERNELYRNANEDFMLELLPVLDHLELALDAVAAHGADDAFLEGFRLVAEQMGSVLAKFGLKAIDAEQGAFDPNQHEAISHLPSEDVAADHIITQVRRGYSLGSRVLRAAQVVVSSGSAVVGGDDAQTVDVEDVTAETVAADDDTSED